MGRLSIPHSQRLMSGLRIAAFAVVLLCISCAGPSAPSERTALRTSAIGASGTPVLSPEFDLDHSPVLERPRACPLVAFGTTSYLVTHSGGQIGYTRFDRGGQNLGTFDIPGALLKSNESGTNVCAPVVFSKGVFVTYWAGADGTLWCTRLAEDGSLLNGTGVSTGISSGAVESVALNGDQVLASMRDGSVALVGTDCSGITAPVSLPATAGTTRWPAGTAFDGTQYWVAYSETASGAADRFFVQAVSVAGAPIGLRITVATAPWVRSAASSYYLPGVQGSVAVGDGRTVVAYGVDLNKPPSPPDFKRFELHFAELSAAGVLSNDTLLSPEFAYPKIAFTRDGVVLVSGAGAYGILKRLNDGSTFSSYDVRTLDMTSLASDGDNVLIATAGNTSGSTRSSYASFVGPDLHTLTGSVFQHMSDRHEAAVVARGTQSSLVVWKPSYNRFLGSRLSADGTILDQQPLAIHQPEPVDGPLVPVVASNGTDFLVAWSGSIAGSGYAVQIIGERVNGAGEVVGRTFEIAHGSTATGGRPAGFEPVVASNGSEYLVVWGHGDSITHDPGGTALYSIEATRITSTGQLLDNPPLVLQTFSADFPGLGVYYNFYGQLAVTYNGAQYVVVSNIALVDDTPSSGDAPIVVQQVSDTGQIGSPIQTPWRSSLNSPPPVISWGEGQGLIAFAHGPQILAGRVNSALQALDEPAVFITDHRTFGNDTRSSVAWDGTNYWLSWKDGRRVGTQYDDIYVTRVSSDAVVLEPSGIPLSQGDWAPEVGTSGAQLVSAQGRVLAAYTRFGLAPNVFNYVLHGRWLESAPATGGQGGQGGSAGTATGIGGQGGAEAGTGGVAGLGAPSDSGGAWGGSIATNGGSISSDGGSTSSGGGSTSSNGGSTSSNGGSMSSDAGSMSSDAGRSGDTASGAGAAAATTYGGASDSTPPPPRRSGCSLGAAPESSKPSLLWLATFVVALVYRRGILPRRLGSHAHQFPIGRCEEIRASGCARPAVGLRRGHHSTPRRRRARARRKSS